MCGGDLRVRVSEVVSVPSKVFLDARIRESSALRVPPYIRNQKLGGPRGPNDQKTFNLARNFQSRSKFLIPLGYFDLDVSSSPQKIGPRWVARSKISFSLEFSISPEISNFS